MCLFKLTAAEQNWFETGQFLRMSNAILEYLYTYTYIYIYYKHHEGEDDKHPTCFYSPLRLNSSLMEVKGRKERGCFEI
jgi:hypothetical protein